MIFVIGNVEGPRAHIVPFKETRYIGPGVKWVTWGMREEPIPEWALPALDNLFRLGLLQPRLREPLEDLNG